MTYEQVTAMTTEQFARALTSRFMDVCRDMDDDATCELAGRLMDALDTVTGAGE